MEAFNLPLPSGPGSLDMKQLSGHAERLWQFLDELAANDPDGYKNFLQQQAKAAGVPENGASSKYQATEVPALILTSRMNSKKLTSCISQPCIISFWEAPSDADIQPARVDGVQLSASTSTWKSVHIPMQMRRPQFTAKSGGEEHQVLELVLHASVLDLVVQGQPAGLSGVVAHTGLQFLEAKFGVQIERERCTVKVLSADAWNNRAPPGAAASSRVSPAAPFNTTAPPAKPSIDPAKAAEGTRLELLPTSLLQELSSLASGQRAAPAATQRPASSANSATPSHGPSYRPSHKPSHGHMSKGAKHATSSIKQPLKKQGPLIQVLGEDSAPGCAPGCADDSAEPAPVAELSPVAATLPHAARSPDPAQALGTGAGSNTSPSAAATGRVAGRCLAGAAARTDCSLSSRRAHSSSLGQGLGVLASPANEDDLHAERDVLSAFRPSSNAAAKKKPLIQELKPADSSCDTSAGKGSNTGSNKGSNMGSNKGASKNTLKPGFLNITKAPKPAAPHAKQADAAHSAARSAAPHSSSSNSSSLTHPDQAVDLLTQPFQTRAATPHTDVQAVHATAERQDVASRREVLQANEAKVSATSSVISGLEYKVTVGAEEGAKVAKVSVQLPGLNSARDVQLDILDSAQTLCLSIPAPGQQSTNANSTCKETRIALPFPVDRQRISARFVRKLQLLCVVLHAATQHC